MTAIVKAGSPAQFLSVLPRMLGYTPRQSVVLVPFAGARSLGVMRFDLPDPDTGAESLERIAATFLGLVCRLPEADAMAAVLYTDEPYRTTRMPQPALFDAIERRADEAGLRVADLLCVAADAWGSCFDRDLPDNGRPLGDLGAAEDPDLSGIAVEGDQTTAAHVVDADAAAMCSTAAALAELRRALHVLCGGPDASSSEREPGRVHPFALAAACTLDDLPRLFEEALAWDPADVAPYRAAMLVWCLGRPAVRDVALLQWSGGVDDGDAALEAQLEWQDGEAYPEHLAGRLWGEGARPDPVRLSAALRLVRRVAALAPPADRPGPLAASAWLSWALGRSTHAAILADQALVIDPGHGLSEIVRTMVDAGRLPDWAFEHGVR